MIRNVALAAESLLTGLGGDVAPVICYVAIENDHRNSGNFPIKNGGSFNSYVKLPEGSSGSRGCHGKIWKVKNTGHHLCTVNIYLNGYV